MVESALRLLDFFAPRHFISNERRVRDRMFIVLLLSSIVMLSSAIIHFRLSGFINAAMERRLAVLFVGQFLCLLILRFFKDTEWPSLFYLIFYQTFQLLDVLQSAPTILNPYILAMPTTLIYGFFCIVHPFKRIVLLSCTLFSTVLAVVLLPDKLSHSYLTFTPRDFASIVCLATFYVNASAVACLYFYDYVKKASEKEMARELDLRIQSIRLGEISLSLKSLIPEFRIALDELERQSAAFEAPVQETKEQLLKDMEIEVGRMRGVSQSVSWVYRAYRKEDVGGILSGHFLEQLDVLMKGKLYYSTWLISKHNEIPDLRLSGPIPTVMLLVLTLADHLVQITQMEGQVRQGMRVLNVTLMAVQNQIGIQLSWPNYGEDFQFDRFERIMLPTRGFDSDYRLELIAELVSSCQGKLEFAQDKESSSILLKGSWRDESAKA